MTGSHRERSTERDGLHASGIQRSITVSASRSLTTVPSGGICDAAQRDFIRRASALCSGRAGIDQQALAFGHARHLPLGAAAPAAAPPASAPAVASSPCFQ